MTTCPACAGNHARSSYLGRGRYGTFEFKFVECSSCQSLFVDPMPGEALLAHMYGPEYVDVHYAAERAGGLTNREIDQELDETVRFLAAHKPGGTVLDVGCGAGRFLIAARKAGLRPEGYEKHPATAAATMQATAINIYSGTLAELPTHFDMVHLGDVLEHCPSPLNLLQEVRRLLASDGLMVVRGPLENQINLFQQAVRLSRLLRGLLGDLPPTLLPPYHLVLFTHAGWRAFLSRSGMRVVQERVHEVHWPAPEQFTLQPLSLIKGLSLALSVSSVGRWFMMGNRVVSILSVDANFDAALHEGALQGCTSLAD